jgi:hypothetical protein
MTPPRKTDAADSRTEADVDADTDADVDADADATGSDGMGTSTASAESTATTETDRGETEPETGTGAGAGASAGHRSDEPQPDVPEDVRSYDRFTKIDGSRYDRVNDFLRDRTYITAREWAIARLCADFRTETGVEMTKIGENLPDLVPFMTDTYSPQAVNQARHAFEEKVTTAGATFVYGAMSGFFTPEELEDLMYEVTEVAKFLLEVEGVDLSVEEELEAEDRISAAMREVRQASAEIRHDHRECPNCGHELTDSRE